MTPRQCLVPDAKDGFPESLAMGMGIDQPGIIADLSKTRLLRLLDLFLPPANMTSAQSPWRSIYRAYISHHQQTTFVMLFDLFGAMRTHRHAIQEVARREKEGFLFGKQGTSKAISAARPDQGARFELRLGFQYGRGPTAIVPFWGRCTTHFSLF